MSSKHPRRKKTPPPAEASPLEPPLWDFSERDGTATWKSLGSQAWFACHVSAAEVRLETQRYHPAYDEEPIRDLETLSPTAFLWGAGNSEVVDWLGDAALAEIQAAIRRHHPNTWFNPPIPLLRHTLRWRLRVDWPVLATVLGILLIVGWLSSYPLRRVQAWCQDRWSGAPVRLVGTVVGSEVQSGTRTVRGLPQRFLATSVEFAVERGEGVRRVVLPARQFPFGLDQEAHRWLAEHFPRGQRRDIWHPPHRPDEFHWDRAELEPSVIPLLLDLALLAFAGIVLAVVGLSPFRSTA